MTGGRIDHDQITQNILIALRSRLTGTGCRPLGPNAGVPTVGNAVRYPDALVTCTKLVGTARLVPGVVVVFEVPSPGKSNVDRVIKLEEYLAVPSIQTYVSVEQDEIAVTRFDRRADGGWAASGVGGDEILRLSPPGIEIPVAEFYLQVDFSDGASP